MIIHSRVSNASFTVSDTESLSQLLQDLVLGSHHSAGSLPVLFFKGENELDTWLSKSQIAAQL
jgi:hypothetical protein